jgi:hypothetical protein
MMETGTGADRQLKVYEENNGDLMKVAAFIEDSFLK